MRCCALAFQPRSHVEQHLALQRRLSCKRDIGRAAELCAQCARPRRRMQGGRGALAPESHEVRHSPGRTQATAARRRNMQRAASRRRSGRVADVGRHWVCIAGVAVRGCRHHAQPKKAGQLAAARRRRCTRRTSARVARAPHSACVVPPRVRHTQVDAPRRRRRPGELPNPRPRAHGASASSSAACGWRDMRRHRGCRATQVQL